MKAYSILLAVGCALALAACGHKPLKAPCSRDEGPLQDMAPMAFTSLSVPKSPAAAAVSRIPTPDACGPMQAVNSDPSLLPPGIKP